MRGLVPLTGLAGTPHITAIEFMNFSMNRGLIAPMLGICRVTSRLGLLCLTILVASHWTANAQSKAQSGPPIELGVATNNNLTIPRSALGKEFLMSASRLPQAVAATSYGLAGKIVRFELFHDGVDLYEATEGLLVTKDLPARRLLTTFPIVEQDANRVIIDFNRGMRRLYTEFWAAYGRSFNPSSRDESLEIPQSRVYKAEIQGNQLVIHQSIQVRDREAQANVEQRYEVRYFFSSYTTNAFQPKEASASDLRYSRFFESGPMLQETTGRPSISMARFDMRKPIVFHYSANTPKEYTQAVTDGILYWNRAFGTNIVRAEKAPEGVSAPDPRYNVIQWVPWDSAGSAYADLLVDPRTGESLHGQVFMTSVFALSSKSRARALLRSMREISDKKAGLAPGNETPAETRPSRWTSHGLCQVSMVEFAQQYSQGLEDLLSNEALSEEATLRASQDYVREVVAHEVGHVLGLRHNFAGSVAATLGRQELDQWFLNYITNKTVDIFTNRFAASSVMDYTVFKSAVQLGWYIRTQTNALPYDAAAIRWGYYGTSEPRDQKVLFGTDDQVGIYGDLQRFDQGTEPLVAAYAQISDEIRLLPNSLIENFIAGKAPRDPRDAVPVAELNLTPARSAASAALYFNNMLYWFRANARSLRVENQFEFIGELNEQDRAKAHWKDLTQQLDQLGGVDRAFFSYLPVDLKLELKDAPKNVSIADKVSAATLQARLKKLLDAPAYTNFVGLDEKKYSFTPAEKEVILKRGEKFFAEFETELVKQICQRFENADRSLGQSANDTIGDGDAVAKLEQRIIDLARLVLTSKDESKRIKGKVDKSMVEVVDFKYDHDTRMAAAKMLNDKTGAFRGWSIDAKSDLNKQLKDEIDGSLNIPNFKDFKESMLSRPLREWYLKQQDVLGLLPPKPPGR